MALKWGEIFRNFNCVNIITFIWCFAFYVPVFNRQRRQFTFTGLAINWNNTGFDEQQDDPCKYRLLSLTNSCCRLSNQTNGKVTFIS